MNIAIRLRGGARIVLAALVFASEYPLQFLQIQNRVHMFLLGVLDPIQDAQVRPIQVRPVFFFADPGSLSEFRDDSRHNRV